MSHQQCYHSKYEEYVLYRLRPGPVMRQFVLFQIYSYNALYKS
jgi:hypothetical protein